VRYSLSDGFVLSASVGRSERVFYEALDPLIRFCTFYFLWGKNKTVFDYICITLFVIAGSAVAIFGIFINAGLFEGPDAAALILPAIGLICGGLILSAVQPVWPIGVFEMFFISIGAIISLCGSPAGAALVSLGSEGFVASIGIAATIDEGSVRLTSILFTFVETVGSFMQYGFASFLSTVTDYFSGEGLHNLSAWLSLLCIVPTVSLAVYNTFTLAHDEERRIEKDTVAKKKTKYRLRKQFGAGIFADEEPSGTTLGPGSAIAAAVAQTPLQALGIPGVADAAPEPGPSALGGQRPQLRGSPAEGRSGSGMRSIVSQNAFKTRPVVVPPDFESLPAAGDNEWFLVTEPGKGLEHATAGPCGSFFRRLIVPRSWYMWNVILILITITMAKASLFNLIMVHSAEHYDPVEESVRYYEFWTLVAGVAIKIVLGLIIGTLGYDDLMEPRILYKFFCVLCAMLVVVLGFAVGSAIYTLITDKLWGTGVIFILVDAFNVIIQPLLLGDGELRLYLALYNFLNYVMENGIWTICEPIHARYPFAGEVTFLCVSFVLEIVFFLVMPWSTRWVHFSRPEENEDIVELDTEALIAVNELVERSTGKPLISKSLLNAELERRRAKELGLAPPTFSKKLLAFFGRSSPGSRSQAPGSALSTAADAADAADASVASGAAAASRAVDPTASSPSDAHAWKRRRRRGLAGRTGRKGRSRSPRTPQSPQSQQASAIEEGDSVCCTPTSELLLTPVLPGSGEQKVDVPGADLQHLRDPGEEASEDSVSFRQVGGHPDVTSQDETLAVTCVPA